MKRTLLKSKIHRATVTDAENSILSTSVAVA